MVWLKMCIRVILADRQNMIREGIHSLLENEPDITVVAEAEQGCKAINSFFSNPADVVVLDMDMPLLSGTEIIRWYVENHQEVKILAFSTHTDFRTISETLSAGVSGYLLKDCAFDELLQAIRTVYQGRKYLTPEVVDIIVKNCFQNQEVPDSSVQSSLTNREREVLQLMAEGKNTRDIAEHLSLSTDTVETYRRQIMQKLNIYNVAELTKYAIREGFTFLDI